MNWNDENHLEVIELYAAEMGWIASEEELSEEFDVAVLPMVVRDYGEDDQPAIDEAFNNWTDSICKDNLIHPLQYSNYCYVGERAKQ